MLWTPPARSFFVDVGISQEMRNQILLKGGC